MEHNRKFRLFLVIVVSLTSACAPVAEATEDTVETPTVVLATTTATQTQEPTATSTVVTSATPEPTPTKDLPELSTVKPAQSFAEFVPEDSPLRGEFFELMQMQFANGGLEKSSAGYDLACIASEDILYYNPHLELPEGYIITHSIPCQYYDAEGNEQLIYLPAILFNFEKESYQFLGNKPVEGVAAADYIQSIFETYTDKYSHLTGPLNIIKKTHGYIGKGHPIIISFSDNLDENFSLADELKGQFITSDDITKFSQSGDPADLPAQLLWPRQVIFENNFPKEPLE